MPTQTQTPTPVPPTRTPTPVPTLGQLGDFCDPNNPAECDSGFCTDGVCCDTDSCPDGQRCDIFSFEGFCSDPLDVDGACDKGTDCLPGLLCVFDPTVGFGVCSPPPTPTPTLFPLNTPLPTLGPIPRIDIGSGRGGLGDAVTITVSLTTSGASVAATVNDITFDTDALSLDPSSCRVTPSIGKSLTAGVVVAGTVRVFVQSSSNTSPIPDGPLYRCTFQIAPLALPATYTVGNGNTIAFSPSGVRLPRVDGASGSLTVSLVPQLCVGDCDGSKAVTVDEILIMVNVALGQVSTCTAGDANMDGHITIDEILAAVNNALNGCF